MKELKQNYKFDTTCALIGYGAFGRVFKSYNLCDPSIQVAIKVIDKEAMGEDFECLIEELRILSLLDHPNIVNHIETYDDKNYVYIGKLGSKFHC